MTVFYDPRYMPWEQWTALLVEEYAAQQLTYPVPEDRWQEFALGIMSISRFNNDAVPAPYGFERWQDWAFAFNNAVN